MTLQSAKICYIPTIIIVLFAFFHGLGINRLSAQGQGVIIDLPNGLTSTLWNGNPYALRDIATYLDEPDYKMAAWSTLASVCAFTKEEIDLSKPISKQDFFNFFYKNKDKIYFEQAVGVYVLTPLELQGIDDFLVRNLPSARQRNKESFELLLKKAESSQSIEIFEQNLLLIQDMNSEASWKALLLFCSKLQKNTYLFDPFPIAAKALRFCPDIKALNLVEKWIRDNTISPQDAEIPLSELLNTYVPAVQKDSMLALIKRQSNGRQSMHAIKQLGYLELSGLLPVYFEDSIDYLGILLADSGNQPWVRHNILYQLKTSKHPKALFFLAAELWRNRNYLNFMGKNGDRLGPLFETIENLTQLQVAVSNYEGATTYTVRDGRWFANHLKYWAAHQEDYVWDEVRGHFINKYRAETVEERARMLFQRLNSSNDSIAREAYIQLTNLDTDLVLTLAEEYRSYATPINPTLPSSRLPFLEQMAKLTDLCGAYNRPWLNEREVKENMDVLMGILEPKQRLMLENKLIATAQLEDLTSIEYAALLHPNHPDFSISSSRVLDNLYAKYWSEIINNDNELYFFLKKSSLFQGIGTHGTCNRYLVLFKNNVEKSRKVLEKIKEQELDKNIILAVDDALLLLSETTESSEVKSKPGLDKNAFLELLEKIDVSPTAEAEDINMIFKSPYFDAKTHLNPILKNLVKLPQPNQLLRLDFPHKLLTQEHLQYFEKLDLDNRTLGQLTRIFSDENPSALFNFYIEKTKDKVVEERGHILTQAFSVHWVIAYFMALDGNANPSLDWTKNALRDYQNEANYLSEFEENQLKFLLLLLETQGKTLPQKLEAALINGSSYRIEQELLAFASWEDLPTLCIYLESLQPSPDGKPGYWFLNRDFGLPPMDFNDPSTCEQYFSLENDTPKEVDVYRKTLQDFGFLDKNKEELPQLYRFLQTERISPFVGGGGFYRDWAVFAAVKILEHEFQETFDFHAKLNENQTFYIYNSGSRAVRWIEFLEKNKKVKPEYKVPTWQ